MKTISSYSLAYALGAVLAIAAFATPGVSHAATISSEWGSNAAGACQGALPAFAGTLRARPLAVQNEGAITAFVTCSFPYNDGNGPFFPRPSEEATLVVVRLINNNTTAANVSCTLVSGNSVATAEYLPKNVSVPANFSAVITFSPSELSGSPADIAAPNVSCGLAPGLGINHVYYFYDRQIGT